MARFLLSTPVIEWRKAQEMLSNLDPSDVTLGLNALSAVATALAAAFSAWSASSARRSALISQESVEEARNARKAGITPRLVLERDFLDFEFKWPHPEVQDGTPAFLARTHDKLGTVARPTFSLSNHGSGPALELQIIFELEDPNEGDEVPDLFAPLGLKVEDRSRFQAHDTTKVLRYLPPDGRGVGLPLRKRITTDLPVCAPGQTRTVEFPIGLLNRLFLRGLQYWDRRGKDTAIQELILTVRINSHTIEGDPYSTQYRFSAFPFWQGVSDPLTVNAHFRELPMFARETGLAE